MEIARCQIHITKNCISSVLRGLLVSCNSGCKKRVCVCVCVCARVGVVVCVCVCVCVRMHGNQCACVRMTILEFR
jgi:hypothetical protein